MNATTKQEALDLIDGLVKDIQLYVDPSWHTDDYDAAEAASLEAVKKLKKIVKSVETKKESNIGRVLMEPTSREILDMCTNSGTAWGVNEDGSIIIDMDRVGDYFPQEKTDNAKELRKLVDKAHEKDCLFLYLY